MNRIHRLFRHGLAIAFLTLAGSPIAASADDIAVATTLDSVDSGEGLTSLREAIGFMNTGNAEANPVIPFAPALWDLGSFATAPQFTLGGGMATLDAFQNLAGNVNGMISGAGALKISEVLSGDPGTIVTDNAIAGDNSPTGSVTVSGTTLTLTNRITDSVTIAKGGTLSLGVSNAVGGTITTTGSVIDYADGITSASPIVIDSNTTQLQVLTGSATQSGDISELNGPRPLEKIGAGILTLTGNNTYAGVTTISAGTLVAATAATLGTGTVTVQDGAMLHLTDPAFSSTFANNLILSGNGVGGKGALYNSGSGLANVVNDLTLTGSITLAGDTRINDDSPSGQAAGPRILMGGVAGGNHALTFGGTGAIIVDGAIQNITSLIRDGSGVTRLSNTGISAPIDLVGGRLILGSGALAGFPSVSVGAGTILDNQGSGSRAVGALTGNGTVRMPVLNSNFVFSFGGDGSSSTFSGVFNLVTGNSLTKAGAGTFTFTGSTSGVAPLTLSGGIFKVGDGGTSGDLGSFSVVNDATLAFDRNDAQTYGGLITGTGNLIQRGTGTLTLSGANTYSGLTTVEKGTLVAASSGALGTSAGGTVVEDGATLGIGAGVTNSEAITINGSGVGGLGAIRAVNTGVIGSIIGSIALGSDSTIGFTAVSDHLRYTTVTGDDHELTIRGSGRLSGRINDISALQVRDGSVTLSNTFIAAPVFVDNAGLILWGNGMGARERITLSTGSTLAVWAQEDVGSINGAGNVEFGIVSSSLTVGGDNTSFEIRSFGSDREDTWLRKIGSGNFTITDSFKQLGGLEVVEGTLQIGNGGTGDDVRLGDSNTSGHNVVYGTLAFNRSDNITIDEYAHDIRGTGKIVQRGTGTLTLSGANTYSGLTTVEKGTLVAASNGALGSSAGGTVVEDGATLAINSGLTVGDPITLNGAGVGGQGALQVLGSGGETYLGAITLGSDSTFFQGSSSIVNFTSLDGAGHALTTLGTGWLEGPISNLSALNANGSNLNLSGTNVTAPIFVNSGNLTSTSFGIGSLTRVTLAAGTTFWSGNATVGSINGPGQVLIVNNTDLTVGGDNTSFTISSFRSSEGSVLNKIGSGTFTVSGNYESWSGVSVGQGTLQIGDGGSGGVLFFSHSDFSSEPNVINGTLAFNRSDDITIGPPALPITGTGNVVQRGTGKLTISGNNTYSGLTTVEKGTLVAASSGALGSSAGGTTVNSGATLLITGTSPTLVLADTLTIGGTGDSGIGAIRVEPDSDTGNKGANLSGGITLTADAAITATDRILLLFTGPGIGLGGSTLTFNSEGTGNSTTRVNSAISGTGGLSKDGAGLLELNAANTFTGPVTLNGGSTLLSGGSALADTIAVTVANAAILDVNASETIGSLAGTGRVILRDGVTLTTGADNTSTTFSGTSPNGMAGTGSLTKVGTGTFTLTGTNSYSGTTTISAGSLQIGGGGTTGTPGSGPVVNNSTLIFNRSDTITFNNVLTGTGSVTKLGAGALILPGTIGHTGGTMASEGTLVVNGTLSAPAAITAIKGNATLGGSGTIVGPVAVTENGQVYPATTAIGTLRTGPLTFASGTTLRLDVQSSGSHDKVQVTGNVALGGATLALVVPSDPPMGSVFTLIEFTGSLTGTFNGLPNNTTFTLGSTLYRLRYERNAVVLYATETPSLTVTTIDDSDLPTDNQISLREALAYAASLTGPQTVTFSNSTADGAVNFHDGMARTITLSGTELFIDHSVTITGPGADKLTLSGHPTIPSRIFTIYNRLQILDVAITGLTLANAKGTSTINARGGGAIHSNFGGNFTLERCVFRDNGLDDGNTTREGGAIWHSDARLVLNQCAFTGNRAIGANGQGGAVFAAGGQVEARSCVFTNNQSGRIGGAVYLFSFRDGSILEDCVFTDNRAESENGVFGGALVAENFFTLDSLELNRCVFERNVAKVLVAEFSNVASGGGAFIAAKKVAIRDCRFDSNEVSGPAKAEGGGLYLASGTNLTIHRTSMTRNQVQAGTSPGPVQSIGTGGGIYVRDGSVGLFNCTIAENTASSSITSQGGGIYSLGTLSLTNCTVAGNSIINSTTASGTVSRGGGIYRGGGAVTLANTIIADNAAMGGATTEGPDAWGAFTSSGNNLVGKSDGSSGFSSGGDQSGTVAAPLLAKLGPVADHGGLVLSVPLLAGSPALDAGSIALAVDENNLPLATDQRGLSRVRGQSVDIGAVESAPARLYVNQGVLPGGNGSGETWPNAMPELRTATAMAQTDPTVSEIWVAQGTYKPAGANSGDRAATFRLRSGLAIYGGFSGAGTETQLDQRNADPETNGTILDGDLNANDTEQQASKWDNSYHVVTGSNTDATAIFDGFTVRRGYAGNGPPLDFQGGGMVIVDGSPSVSRVLFFENYANSSGGGVFHHEGSPVFDQVTFRQNHSPTSGGAISTWNGSLVLKNSTLVENSASSGYGGGVEAFGGGATLINVVLEDNSNGSRGGAFAANAGNHTLINVRVTGSSAGRGAVFYAAANARVTAINSTLVGNTAGFFGSFYNYSNGTIELQNSIYWNNGTPIFGSEDNTGSLTVKNSIVQGSGGSANWQLGTVVDGGGNLDVDPQFVDAANGNLRLRSTSPAIDAGDNSRVTATADLDGAERIIGGTVDLGAYELIAAPTLTQRDLKVATGGTLSDLATLTGASPDGGVFSGTGVSIDGNGNYIFDSSGMPLGTEVTVTYTVSGPGGTSNETDFTITVLETPSLTVTTTIDPSTDIDGLTSLREAIAYANELGGAREVTFDPTAFAAPQTISLTTGLPEVTCDLTITGTGAKMLTISDGTNNGGGGSLTLLSVTDGSLSITGMTLVGGATGISAENATELAISACVLRDHGVAVTTGSGVSATILGTTIHGNTTGLRSGDGSTMLTINLTIADNVTGIANTGTFLARHATITGNDTGLSNELSATLANTICAGNVTDIAGPQAITEAGDNLIGMSADDAGLDPVGLRDNGGPTDTVRLLPGSSAIDAGDNALAVDESSDALTIDQRGTGFARVVKGSRTSLVATADIGAFELFAAPEFLTDEIEIQIDGKPLDLATATGVSPSGGVFSGPGVSAGFFDPRTQMVGSYEITYTYTGDFGIINTSTFIIDVIADGGSLFLQKAKAFPLTQVGRKSKVQRLSLTNRGDLPVSGIRLVLRGEGRKDFKITQPNLKTLAPLKATTYRVSFHPKKPGSRRATVMVLGSGETTSGILKGKAATEELHTPRDPDRVFPD